MDQSAFSPSFGKEGNLGGGRKNKKPGKIYRFPKMQDNSKLYYTVPDVAASWPKLNIYKPS
jgi:hypothetical protein